MEISNYRKCIDFVLYLTKLVASIDELAEAGKRAKKIND
jgi:hypothetical protein